MHIILSKVVSDNLKVCPRFVRRSNHECMQSGFQAMKYHCKVEVNEMTHYQVLREETSIDFTNISKWVYSW